MRLYHGRLRPHRGERLPSDAREIAAAVEAEYGLPPGSILHHQWFSAQQHRSGDTHYYVAPREDAEEYARSGGEALGDALQAAYDLLHPGQMGAKTPDGTRWAWVAWAEEQVRRFGTPELEQVDVPHDVIRQIRSGPWPAPDDEQGWAERVAAVSGVAGIGLTPAQRARTQIDVAPDWAQQVDSRLPGGGVAVPSAITGSRTLAPSPRYAVDDLKTQTAAALSDDDIAALSDYVESGTFDPLNAALRGVERSDEAHQYDEFLTGIGDEQNTGYIQQASADLDAIIDKVRTQYPLRLYRGVDKYRPGVDLGYMSTSTDPKVALQFGPVLLRIDYPIGEPAIAVDAIDRITLGQQEVLLPRGLHPREVSRRVVDGVTIISLRVDP